MRALSLWQPWASLIAFGAKRFETRSYATGVKGKLAIHAAKKQDRDCLALCLEEPFRSALVAGGIEKIGDLPFGAVVAIVNVTDCHRSEDIRDTISPQEREFGIYLNGRFAWELELVKKLEKPVPARGAQGFWFWKPNRWSCFENEQGTWTVAEMNPEPDSDDGYDVGDVVEVYPTHPEALRVCQIHNGSLGL